MQNINEELKDMSYEYRLKEFGEISKDLEYIFRYRKSLPSNSLIEIANKLLSDPKISKENRKNIEILKISAYFRSNPSVNNLQQMLECIHNADIYQNQETLKSSLINYLVEGINKETNIWKIIEWINLSENINVDWIKNYSIKKFQIMIRKEIITCKDLSEIKECFLLIEKSNINHLENLRIAAGKMVSLLKLIPNYLENEKNINDIKNILNKYQDENPYIKAIVNLELINEKEQFLAKFPKKIGGNKLEYNDLTLIEVKSVEKEFEYFEQHPQNFFLRYKSKKKVLMINNYTVEIESEPFLRTLVEELQIRNQYNLYFTESEYKKLIESYTGICELVRYDGFDPRSITCENFVICADGQLKLYRLDIFNSINLDNFFSFQKSLIYLLEQPNNNPYTAYEQLKRLKDI